MNLVENRAAQIQKLESVMRQMPQVEIKPIHSFGPGFYARTINIPKGTTLTGKIHSTEHIFILSKGEIILVTEDGEMHAKAPFQSVCRAGMKRVGHALTDAVCTNIHITEETDIQKLEGALILPDALEYSEQKALP